MAAPDNTAIKRTSEMMENSSLSNNQGTSSQLHFKPLSRRQRGSLSTLLNRKSPFSNETGSLPIGEFDTSAGQGGASSLLRNAKILVVGAGGLGCEILKDLAMCGVVRDVVVMDLGELVCVFIYECVMDFFGYVLVYNNCNNDMIYMLPYLT